MDDNSEAIIFIDDMENIIDYYPFSCEKCGKIIDKKSNRFLIS